MMAKREVKSVKGAKIPSPAPPRAEEQQLEDFIKYMIEEMQERYKNQVFKELHKSTIEKFHTEAEDALPEQLRQMFADQQVGNFANVFLRLAKKVRRKLTKQFPDDRLEEMAKKITEKVNKRNRDVFYNAAKRRIGIDKAEFEATEGLTYQINAYQLETAQWIKKMRDETLQNWTANTLRDMAEGRGIDDIMSQFDSMVEQRKNHAQMVARTQISTFNSLVTKTRARNLGIEKAIWITSEDERVRNCHAERHGREFNLAEGLYSSCDGKTLLPGVDYNCRCTYQMVIPPANEEDMDA
jgi:SPP1 gp7 family putative phage head morphogenesis protein